jgi:dipeptidyl aminopeptidase/acylaminoacyl peptidase
VDVWTIGADGSGLRQVTHDGADETRPSWSRDGRFIYFESNRTQRVEIWRTPPAGGPEEQVTHEGGLTPMESWDGQTLYYRRVSDNALLARPRTGGEERTILRCVQAYTVGRHSIFYLQCGALGATASQLALRQWDGATGQDRPVATIDGPMISGLSVSPDGRMFLYGPNTWNSDLMMIENFR